ncbi:MAG: transketolase family protein [Candidatus Thorarchaeota archaeon SMTZ1-83]
MEPKSTREAYGEALVQLGLRNRDVVVLDADLSLSTKTRKFKEKHPGRFFNVGCAEQNLIGTAAGLAIGGKVVFASTFSIFTHRAWEQIRNVVAYDCLNVKIVGSHGGLTASKDGASHQALEDLALMRIIPGMSVIVPVDAVETRQVIVSEAARTGPAYIRLNREPTPEISAEDYEFQFGKAVELRDGEDVTIIATGTMVHKAIEASAILSREGLDARVLNIHTIKPIDEATIIRSAEETGAMVTVEEHSVLGGLGSAVAEVVVGHCPSPITFVGVKDRYGESGTYDELLNTHGLTVQNVVKAARAVFEKKRERA